MVSPDHHPDRALYNVGVALRLVDRLLADFEVGTTPERHGSAVRELRCSPGELTGRVAHALMLAETLSEEATRADHGVRADVDPEAAAGALQQQLRQTLRGLLLDLERRAPQPEAV